MNIIGGIFLIILLLLISFVLGIPMGLSSSHVSIQDKMILAAVAISALALFITGIRKRKTQKGKPLMIVGLVVWIIVSFWGGVISGLWTA